MTWNKACFHVLGINNQESTISSYYNWKKNVHKTISKVREMETNHWVEDKLFPTQLQ